MSEQDTTEEDAQKNKEDAQLMEDTPKFDSLEDGEQPAPFPLWNDDSGEVEIL